jgi:hypothetical protein
VNQPQKRNETQDESLAAVPPTPIDVAQLPPAGNLALGTIMLTAAGAGAILLIAGTMTPAMGATRSTKLQWEERKIQIEQAERDVQVNPQVDAKPDDRNDAQPNVAEED